MISKMISGRLNYISGIQQRLRADDYIHLRDTLNEDAIDDPLNICQHSLH